MIRTLIPASPFLRHLLVALAAICSLAPGRAGALDAPAAGEARTVRLGRPGFLIIGSARDTVAAFSWRDGPGPGRRTLVWPDGQFVVPDTIEVLEFGPTDLGVAVGPDLQGSGVTGVLAFADGLYPLTEPLLLTDGSISLMASAGALEIRGPQLRYRPPAVDPKSDSGRQADPRAGYLFLSGLVILVLVLLRRARLVARQRRPGP